jgi:acetyl esterase/lipase
MPLHRQKSGPLKHAVVRYLGWQMRGPMKRAVISFLLGVIGSSSAAALGAEPLVAPARPITLDLWPGKAPGETVPIDAEKFLEDKPGGKQVKRLTNISKPSITVYRPAKGADTGAAVIIAPGGGYYVLAWDLEGEEVAAWLNSIGVTAVLLKYRVPRRPGHPKDRPPPGALQDAQRAISVVRSRAAGWGIDPARIGMLGFSAGGHLAAWAASSFDQRAYKPVDAADKVSCRPDFSVLIYPAYLIQTGTTDLSPELRISDRSPPTFFVHAGDDQISSENSALMYVALKRAKVPAELHLYPRGGHGFGLRPSDDPISAWPQRCAEWMKSMGLLARAAAP